MKGFPPTPPLAEAPNELLDGGHLWLLELVDGGHLRFRMDASGLLTFGDAERVYATPTDLPPQYQPAIRAVQTELDREAFRTAVDDVGSVVFCGRATYRRSVDYDWTAIPPFLGYDVWSEADGDWLQPDAAEQVFETLGIPFAPVIDRERRTRDFTGVERLPTSAYYDGPVAGVLVRNKAGGRARRTADSFGTSAPATSSVPDLEDLVDRFTTAHRIERLVTRSPDAERRGTLIDLVIESIYREAPTALEGHHSLEERTVREAVARRLGELETDHWSGQ